MNITAQPTITPRNLRARTRASMAVTHLELADERSQPGRLEHQQAAQRQLRAALRALDREIEADR